MNKLLEAQLITRYPLILKEVYGSWNNTCLTEGINVDDELYPFLDDLFREIQKIVDEEGCEQVIAEEVTLKDDQFAFFYDGGNDKVFALVDEYEARWLREARAHA